MRSRWSAPRAQSRRYRSSGRCNSGGHHNTSVHSGPSWSRASKFPQVIRLSARQRAIEVSSGHPPGRSPNGPPPISSVTGGKLPGGWNSTVVPTASPTANPARQPVKRAFVILFTTPPPNSECNAPAPPFLMNSAGPISSTATTTHAVALAPRCHGCSAAPASIRRSLRSGRYHPNSSRQT